MATYQSEQGPGPQVMGASTITGDDVRSPAGEDLGKIEEVMLDMTSGKVTYAVLSFGGVLGMGSKLFAIPWSALELPGQQVLRPRCRQGKTRERPRIRQGQLAFLRRPQMGHADPLVLRFAALLGNLKVCHAG